MGESLEEIFLELTKSEEKAPEAESSVTDITNEKEGNPVTQ